MKLVLVVFALYNSFVHGRLQKPQSRARLVSETRSSGGQQPGVEDQQEVELSVPPSELLDHASEMHRALRSLAANCDQLGCSSEYLLEEADSLGTLIDAVQDNLDPLESFFGDVLSAQSRVKDVETIRSTVLTVTGVLKNLPGLSAIGSIETTLKGFGTLIEPLDSGLTNAKNSIVQPYDTAVTSVLEKLSGAQGKLSEVIDSVGGFADVLEGQCVKTIFNMAPGFPLVLQTVTDLIVNLADIVHSLKSIMSTLLNALADTTWKNIQSGLNSISSAVNSVFKPMDVLQPILSLMDKKITISYPDDLIEKECPAGTENYGVQCLHPCDTASGWEKSGPLCQKKCPKKDDARRAWESQGIAVHHNNYYKDTGVSCTNYFDEKPFRFASNCKKDERQISVKGVLPVCVKKCGENKRKAGWKTRYRGIGICHAPCPSDFISDGDLGFNCIKPTKTRRTSDKKCKSGTTNVGLLCMGMRSRSFTVNKLIDQIASLEKTFSGLPVVEQVKDAMGTALDTVFSAILAVVQDVLNIKIPTFGVSISSPLNFDGISANLDQLKDVNVPGPEVVTFMNDMISSAIDSIGVADIAGLIDCEDNMMCYASKLGIDLPDISTIIDALPDVGTDIFSPIVNIMTNITGCDEEKTLNLCPAQAFAELIGQDVPSDLCNIPIEVCTGVQINEGVFEEAVDQLKHVLEPIADIYDHFYDSLNERRQLLSPGNAIDNCFDRMAYEQDIVFFPLGPLLSPSLNVKHGQIQLDHVARHLKPGTPPYDVVKREYKTELYSLSVNMRKFGIALSVGRKGDGRRYTKTRIQNGLTFSYEKYNGYFSIVTRLVNNLKSLVTTYADGICKKPEIDEVCSARMYSGCNEICDLYDKLETKTPFNVEVSDKGNLNIQDFMNDHNEKHSIWKEIKGGEIGQQFAAHLLRMQKDLEKAKKMRKRTLPNEAPIALRVVGDILSKSAAFDTYAKLVGGSAQMFFEEHVQKLSFNTGSPKGHYVSIGVEAIASIPFWPSSWSRFPQTYPGIAFGVDKHFPIAGFNTSSDHVCDGGTTNTLPFSTVKLQAKLPSGIGKYREAKFDGTLPKVKLMLHVYMNNEIGKSTKEAPSSTTTTAAPSVSPSISPTTIPTESPTEAPLSLAPVVPKICTKPRDGCPSGTFCNLKGTMCKPLKSKGSKCNWNYQCKGKCYFKRCT